MMKPKILLSQILIFFSLFAPGQNINLSGGVIFDGEPYLAINPQNPRHMVVAWMGYVFLNRIMIKTRVSFNGGTTWSSVQNTQHVAEGYTSADPSVDFDSNGNVFLCLIDYDPYFTSGAVYIRKSTDGGLSWGNPVEVINYNSDPGKLPIDRPWISIDRSGGENNGYIYVTTMNASGADGPPYHPYFIRSTDNGVSFGPWRYADTTGWLSGSLVQKPMPTPVVTSGGTFHCAYPSYVISQNILPRFILASSENGGTGFTYSTLAASAASVAVTDTSAKKGYLLRANPSNPLHLAFFHMSNENGDADVCFRESMDGGSTWSDGLRVNDDPVSNGRMQDLVWAAFDTDGDLVATWRDRRNAPDTGYAASYEMYAAVRLKNTQTFSSNFRISDLSVPFDDILLENGNDFMCTSLCNDTISAVWGDTRDGKLNIWFQRTTLEGNMVSSEQIAKEDLPRIRVFQNNPNSLIIEAAGIKNYTLLNGSGKVICCAENLPGSNAEVVEIPDLATAVYLLKVETGDGMVVTKVLIGR
ncbi:MAG: T9SS type A sorting domain-containing protein [Lentimicrobium sp.]